MKTRQASTSTSTSRRLEYEQEENGERIIATLRNGLSQKRNNRYAGEVACGGSLAMLLNDIFISPA